MTDATTIARNSIISEQNILLSKTYSAIADLLALPELEAVKDDHPAIKNAFAALESVEGWPQKREPQRKPARVIQIRDAS